MKCIAHVLYIDLTLISIGGEVATCGKYQYCEVHIGKDIHAQKVKVKRLGYNL